ncbi:hypothetical protein Pcinc_004869 [Petrolisthes cinctipes]|uniref:CLIP domain-containing serine protease n=1 Tax=Petrolisthes cinctipes TaxID=88211 RepID=A0AAE1GG83_PETCI|nr:hypothetical protein Pcinc_004869 [Petrolisthes cinctipes]
MNCHSVFLVLLIHLATAQIFFPSNNNNNNNNNNLDYEVMDALMSTVRIVNNINPYCLRGHCVLFSQCANYHHLITKLCKPSVLDFIRSRICRVENNKRIYICCPNTRPPNPPNPTLPPIIPCIYECGVSRLTQLGRVVGGVNSVEGKWPWLASVGFPLDNHNFRSVCGGTVITRRHVLTAAHCFGPDPTHVRLGEHNLTKPNDAAPQDFSIARHIENGFNKRTHENDISILVLDRIINFGDYVQPACLPFTYKNNYFLTDSFTVIGWGKSIFGDSSSTSLVPREAEVPTVPTALCQAKYQRWQSGAVIDERNICAGNGVQDTCTGDSGGPLNYLGHDRRYYVVGLVSYGIVCGKVDYPGVYTRISTFLDWIVEKVQQ